MSKKIIFLITYIFLSISNNTQTMFSALFLSGGSSNDTQEQDDENCCFSCLRISTVLLATIFAGQSNQVTDFEHDHTTNLDFLTRSHFSISEYNKIK